MVDAIIKEYYNNEFCSNNILSINSLKEQGIAYYRNEVKVFCQTTSSIHNKKKFVIINDIDTINDQSQQVFRNFIDKYKKNVHFLITCSNINKVIDTLQSRLTIIKLEPITREKIENIINKITITENIVISDDVKKYIIDISNNSIRTVINYLEKFKLLGSDIILDKARYICSNISYIDLEEYTEFCKIGKLTDALQKIYYINNKGYSLMDIYDSYFIYIKHANIIDETVKYEIIKILCNYISIFYNKHENDIELTFFTNNIIKLFSNH
jgi:DNA polymerase III delta prime subunit